MGWFEYVTLIESGNTGSAAWANARKGNPNTPEGALKDAIEHVATDDLVTLIMKLTTLAATPPASNPVDAGAGLSNHDLKLWALSNVDNPAVLAAIDKLVAGNATLQAELASAQQQGAGE